MTKSAGKTLEEYHSSDILFLCVDVHETKKKSTVYLDVTLVAKVEELYPLQKVNVLYRAYVRSQNRNGQKHKIPFNRDTLDRIKKDIRISNIRILKSWKNDRHK